MLELARHLSGVIVGTAVGDAIGLPREALSRRRANRLFGAPPLRHRLMFGRGMISDDTEHTCMVGQALLRSGGVRTDSIDPWPGSCGGGSLGCRRAQAWPLQNHA